MFFEYHIQIRFFTKNQNKIHRMTHSYLTAFVKYCIIKKVCDLPIIRSADTNIFGGK